MTIQITWHLIIMLIVSMVLIFKIFNEQEGGLDLSAFFYGGILFILWLIYGGIFYW